MIAGRATCLACGYDLAGLGGREPRPSPVAGPHPDLVAGLARGPDLDEPRAGRCPECGEAFSLRMMGARAEPRQERAETLWAWPWLAATLRVWAIVALVLGAGDRACGTAP